VRRKNPEEFNRNFEDPAQAEANLRFLNEQLVETLYPFAVQTNVRPGVLIKIRPSLEFAHKNITILLGYDFWRQGKEKFRSFCAPNDFINTLEIERGRRPRADQQKIFAIFSWAFCCTPNYELNFTLKADATIQNRGIGKDYTGLAGIEFRF
jgi:hypothetical protein